MTFHEIAALMEEIDIMFPPGVARSPEEHAKAVKLWHDWLGAYSWATARQALRAFGGQQRAAPSPAQILGECKRIAGELLPGADAVLAEFARVNGPHSSQGVVDPSWFSSPAIGLWAASGAYRDWGESADASADAYLAASQAAAQAALRRRWEEFSGDVERRGLVAAAERIGIAAPAPVAIEAAAAIKEIE